MRVYEFSERVRLLYFVCIYQSGEHLNQIDFAVLMR